MKILLKFLEKIIVIVAVVVAHFWLFYILPKPLNYINLSLVYITLKIALGSKGGIIWQAFFIGFLFDLFSSEFFGLYIIAFSITTLLIYWLHRDILTNKSIWSLSLMTVIAVILFRGMYDIPYIIHNYTGLYIDLLYIFLSEIVLTLLCAILSYPIVLFVRPRQKRLMCDINYTNCIVEDNWHYIYGN